MIAQDRDLRRRQLINGFLTSMIRVGQPQEKLLGFLVVFTQMLNRLLVPLSQHAIQRLQKRRYLRASGFLLLLGVGAGGNSGTMGGGLTWGLAVCFGLVG